jgi:hypothetical protein
MAYRIGLGILFLEGGWIHLSDWMNTILADANTQMIVRTTALITWQTRPQNCQFTPSAGRQAKRNFTFSKYPIVGWRMKSGVTRIDSPHTQLLRPIALPNKDLIDFLINPIITHLVNLYRLALIVSVSSNLSADPADPPLWLIQTYYSFSIQPKLPRVYHSFDIRVAKRLVRPHWLFLSSSTSQKQEAFDKLRPEEWRLDRGIIRQVKTWTCVQTPTRSYANSIAHPNLVAGRFTVSGTARVCDIRAI